MKRLTLAALLAMLPLGSVVPSVHAQAGCPEVIVEVFGYLAYDACYVSYIESKWRAGETGALGERGYFQIHPIHPDSTYDPRGNALAAYRLSKGGTDWCTAWKWTCS